MLIEYARAIMELGALVVMAGGFVYMVKVVTNDMNHDVKEIKADTKESKLILSQIRDGLLYDRDRE